MDGISTIGDAFWMTESKQLEIEHKGKAIPYQWRVSSRARHYRVMVGSRGVELVTPEGVGHAQAEKFLRLHGDWVLAQLERVEKLESKRRPPNAAMAVIPSGMTFLEGKPVRLDFRKDPKLKTRLRVEELPGCLRISTPKEGREGAEAALESFLKEEGRAIDHGQGGGQSRGNGTESQAGDHPQPENPLGELLQPGNVILQLASGHGSAGRAGLCGHS